MGATVSQTIQLNTNSKDFKRSSFTVLDIENLMKWINAIKVLGSEFIKERGGYHEDTR